MGMIESHAGMQGISDDRATIRFTTYLVDTAPS